MTGLLFAAMLVFNAEDAARPRNNCGKASCYLMLRQLGREPDREALDQRFAGSGRQLSLADMSRVMESVGEPVVGLKVGWEDLKGLDAPAIAKVVIPEIGVHHFHVVRRIGAMVMIVDPLLDAPIVLDDEGERQYQQVFTGYVLVPKRAVPWRFWLGAHRITVSACAATLIAFLGVRLGRRCRGTDIQPPDARASRLGEIP